MSWVRLDIPARFAYSLPMIEYCALANAGAFSYGSARNRQLNSFAALQHVIQHHFSGKAAELQSFVRTGYSFEEWFNWELFHALQVSESGLQPKPSYRHLANLDSSRKTGDVFFTKEDHGYIVEVALVHDYTSDNKWRAKVHQDRDHLLTLKEVERVTPIQLLLLVSNHNDMEASSDWMNWLESLHFWNDPKALEVKIRLPQQGQAWIVGWAV
ncbi:hypothetical protein [Halomonas sp. WWR20]